MQLILIHGFGCDASDWSAQMGPLGRSTDTLAVRLPHARRAGGSPRSLIVEMAEAVNRARTASAQAGVVLIGHSLGCRVALEAVRLARSGVKGLVLIEGSLRATGDADEAVRTYRSRSARENKASLMRDFAGMFGAATPEPFRRSVLRRIEDLDDDDAADLMADMTRWDAAEAAGALRYNRAPILIIQSTYKEPGGERRAIGAHETSPWLRLVAERAGGPVEVVRLEGLGHFPQIEAPAVVNGAILSFTARLAALAEPELRGKV